MDSNCCYQDSTVHGNALQGFQTQGYKLIIFLVYPWSMADAAKSVDSFQDAHDCIIRRVL